MIDRSKNYTTAEKNAYVADPCEKCGSEIHVKWKSVSTFRDNDSWAISLTECSNRRCRLGLVSIFE
jgi:hypothetical protein